MHIVDRLLKRKVTENIESQLVGLTELEMRMCVGEIYAITMCPTYYRINDSAIHSKDFSEDHWKAYPAYCAFITFCEERRKHMNDLVQFISNYEKNAYVDDQVILTTLLQSGKKWNLIDSSHNTQLKYLKDNMDAKDGTGIDYEQFIHHQCQFYFTNGTVIEMDEKEYDICKQYWAIKKTFEMLTNYFNILKMPAQLLEIYGKFLISVHDFYGNKIHDTGLSYVDIFSLKYYAKTNNNEKVIEIQLKIFNVQRNPFSLYDLCMCHLNLNEIEKAQDLVRDHFDIFLQIKTMKWKLYLLFVECVRFFTDAELVERISNECFNEIFLYHANRKQFFIALQNITDNMLENKTECLICVKPFELKDRFVLCMRCNTNLGHGDCVDTWWKISNSCINCRSPLTQTSPRVPPPTEQPFALKH